MLKDNAELSKLFKGTPRENSLKSILLGVLAMTVEFFGYLSICAWMRDYSPVCALILLLSVGVIFIPGVHLQCAAHLFGDGSVPDRRHAESCGCADVCGAVLPDLSAV